MTETLHSLAGAFGILALAWLAAERRDARVWRVAFVGLALQIVLAAVLLKAPGVRIVFEAVNAAVLALQAATTAGSGFVFGYLGGGPLPFEESRPGASFILAFRALPLIVFVSALSALLTYWGILPWVIRRISRLLESTLGIGGAVGLGSAANVFVGMVEAPLLVRPYVAALSRSELFVLMCTGMATIAGTVLVLYATVLADVIPDAAGHLLVASLISAPAAITVALIMVPDDGTRTGAPLDATRESAGAMDALVLGTERGVRLLITVAAMLLVFVALVYLVNAGLDTLPHVAGAPVTLERLLGLAFAPIAWLIGIPWSEAPTAGAILGTKTVLNELLAYLSLAATPAEALSERSRLILTYALCGFANPGSLGILIGGLATIAPERRHEIVSLGMRALLGGTLATCLTGAVVGMLT